ncbi:phosphopentomutase [Coprothermobacter platensis]|uniref:phosphopentomutase n=1 Tax=Coprothermobacter platensis TaxID=108819 RepID=UPI00035EDE7E|nr:phosphopentomutase [Coprothermobacter platensis]
MRFDRVFWVVIDSFGVGAEPDCEEYDDIPSLNTALHVIGDRPVPDFLWNHGLGYLVNGTPLSVPATVAKLQELSKGKDSTTGHWEMAGLVLTTPFPTYPNGFPPEIMEEFERRIGRKTLGNFPASGTEIIKQLGEEHVRTGYPIVYTSADSVFQIAAHEDVIPVEELYHMCQIARDLLTGDHAVARVIARPFAGKVGEFYRTPRRHDFSLPPLGHTVLDELVEKNIPVCAVGKIHDLFAGRGMTESIHTESDADGLKVLKELSTSKKSGLIYANLVDSDMVYGHRRNVQGYYENIMMIDQGLKELYQGLTNNDLLIVTADHGNDPTYSKHTDHTREYVPFLAISPRFTESNVLGTIPGYVHEGQTVIDALGVSTNRSWGKNLLKEG